MDRGAWWAAVHGVAESQTRLSDFTFTFHFHALEKEMPTHSSVLAWRIPGMGEPGGLPSMGSHRVGHDWSDLAAAAECGYHSSICCLWHSSPVMYSQWRSLCYCFRETVRMTILGSKINFLHGLRQDTQSLCSVFPICKDRMIILV